MREQVVDTMAFGTLAAGREALDQKLGRDVEMDHAGLAQPAGMQQIRKVGGLRHGARITVQEEAGGAIGGGGARGYRPVDDCIADQLAACEQVTDALAEPSSRLGLGAEHFARGDGWYVEFINEELRLSPLAATRRPEEQDNHTAY
jgi:hypothetical protein